MDTLPEEHLPRDTVIVPADSAPFRKMIDSTLMLSIARFAMPLIIAALGWFFVTMLSDLKTGQKEGLADLKDGQRQVWMQISKMADTQSATNNVQSALVVKVDGTVKQLDRLQTQVDGLQKH